MNFAKIIGLAAFLPLTNGQAFACSETSEIISIFQMWDNPNPPHYYDLIFDYMDELDQAFDHDDDETYADGFFPIVYGRMCSFAFAGGDDDMTGSPVGKLGPTLIAQTIFNSSGCSPSSSIVLSDCQKHEAIFIRGKGPSNEPDFAIRSMIEHHLAPEGPIDVQEMGSISDISLAATEAGLRFVTLAGPGHFSPYSMEPDTIDPYCGCKIYYPDSAGASN